MVRDENPFEHILYEIEMYLITCRIDPVYYKDNQLLSNVIVDSHAIHLRNLAYFFNKSRTNDLNSSDFFDNDNLFLSRNKCDKIKQITSNATCHLSIARLSETYKDETNNYYKKIYPIMADAISRFLDALDNQIKDEYKNQWEDEHIQIIVNYIRGELLKPNTPYATGQTGSIV